jgi:hypothetical protein
MIKLSQKGQSLVEALIALGVATIVVSAMAVAAITAVNNSDFSKYQNLATDYAQQGIEVVRQKSQADWSGFYTAYVGSWPSGKSWCLSQDSTTLNQMPIITGCLQNISGQNGLPFFVRDVTLTQHPYTAPPPTPSSVTPACNGNVQVEVRVSWTDGKCSSSTTYCHNVILDSCLVNINAVSAP